MGLLVPSPERRPPLVSPSLVCREASGCLPGGRSPRRAETASLRAMGCNSLSMGWALLRATLQMRLRTEPCVARRKESLHVHRPSMDQCRDVVRASVGAVVVTDGITSLLVPRHATWTNSALTFDGRAALRPAWRQQHILSECLQQAGAQRRKTPCLLRSLVSPAAGCTYFFGRELIPSLRSSRYLPLPLHYPPHLLSAPVASPRIPPSRNSMPDHTHHTITRSSPPSHFTHPSTHLPSTTPPPRAKFRHVLSSD